MDVIRNSVILVIGGTGFIGSHLVKALISSDCTIYSLSCNTKSDIIEHTNVRYFYFDLTSPPDESDLFKIPFDYIINLSGYVNHSPYFNGGLSVLQVHHSFLYDFLIRLNISRLQRFVQIGSSDEYGLSNSPQRESQRELPFSPYSFAKVASTHFLQMLYRSSGFPVVILRVFLTYGPGQSTQRFIPYVINRCLNNQDILLSACTQTRDFIHISDLISVICLSLCTPNLLGEVINIGSGDPIQLKVVVQKIVDICGSGTPVFSFYDSIKQENPSLYPSLVKVQSILDWRPLISLESGLKSTINSFR